MRLIPGKTKVQIELFKGVTLTDIAIGLVAAILLLFILTSMLPGKIYFVIGLVIITAVLLIRLDTEPNYIYLLHIVRHLGYRHRFARKVSDRVLTGQSDDENEPSSAAAETPEERKARLKAEREERAADDKKLKDKNTTKEEADAIWLKRAQQSAAAKQRKKEKANTETFDMTQMIPFTDIKEDFICYGGEYFGAVIEIDPVEFRFFSPHRRNHSIENGFGRVLRSIAPDYAANIVKIERPILYDNYLQNEKNKIEELRASFEKGFVSEQEFQARIEVLCERINELENLCFHEKVIQPFYYLVLYDSDKTQLNVTVANAMETMTNGEMKVRRLDTKGLAIFLKYTNCLDFDEREIDKVAPEKYVEWAMPETVNFNYRTIQTNGIISHNMRVVNYPSLVDDAWLASVMSMPATKVVVKCKPMNREKAVRGIDRSLQELRGQFMNTGVDSKKIELQDHIDTLSSLLAMLQGDNESLLECNVFITAYDAVATQNAMGKDKKLESSLTTFNNMKRLVRRTYQENNLRLNNMEFDQVNAFVASQISAFDPFGSKGRGIPSNSVAACYPWVFAHIADKNGIKLGTADGAPVFIDFFRRDSERVNSNMVIVGKSGSGKSYATKSFLTNLAADDAKIFILDPENEYTELANNLHGKFINVGNAQFGRLNPFHIITALDDDESDGSTVSGSYATHLQFLEEFFRQILPDCDKDAMEYLNSIIDRMYTNKGITAETELSKLNPEDYPTFDDLYDGILTEFQSTDNEYIRTMLRTLMNYVAKFSSGGRNANIWNGPSTVTTEENFTVFNFQSLLANRNGSIANAQMLLVLKYIDNEIIKNRDYNTKYHLKRKVVVVIDEAHVFIDTKYPVALDFMFQLAKRIRKYNGMQIVITQNIKDFVGSEEIARKSTAIINACQYSFIFSLAPNDMDDLCKLYEKAGGINEQEQEEIVSAPRGQAFAVMSPQSRSTFRVQVPKDVVAMFEESQYETRYFGGEDGRERWDNIVGGSRELYLAEKQKRQEAAEAVKKEVNAIRSTGSAVSFTELTPEQYEEMTRQQAEKAVAEKITARPVPVQTKEDDEDWDVPEIPDDPAEFEKMLRKEPEEKPQAAVSPAAQPAQTQVPPTVVVQAPPVSGETERMLGELLNKFSYDAMIEEIRRSVRQELDKETAERKAQEPVAAEMPAAEQMPAETETTAPADESTAIGRIEPKKIAVDAETGLPIGEPETEEIEEARETEEQPAQSEDAEGSFDILKMLMNEAKDMKETSPIDLMVEYDEEMLEITLEELIQYNTQHD